MKAVKFLLVDYSVSSRDIREVAVLEDMGADVSVVSQIVPEKLPDSIDEVIRWTKTTPQQSPVIRKAIIAKNWVSAAAQLRKLDCEVLSCHNIYALFIGWLSTVVRSDRPELVYDAHELEVARNVGGGARGGLGGKVIARLERFLMRRCAFTIAVNDSIADEMLAVHGLPGSMRPVVVRSTPSYWEYDAEAVARNRAGFCRELGVDPDTAFLAMYHGGLMPDRGIEQIIEAVSRVEGCRLVVMGNGDDAYAGELRALADACGVADRVLFHPAVDRGVLESHVAAADVGLVVLQNVTKNHFFTLPNKFFENIQAEVPVIAANFPELSRIVGEYGIGLTVDPHDVDAIASSLERMRDDAALRQSCKEGLKEAKGDLCWEREQAVLRDAYGKAFA